MAKPKGTMKRGTNQIHTKSKQGGGRGVRKPKRENIRPRLEDNFGKFLGWQKMLAPGKNGNIKVCENVRKTSKPSGIYEQSLTKETKGRKEEKREVVYVGKAARKDGNSLAKRLKEYCRNGSHLHEEIADALKKGKQLEARVKPTAPSRAVAAEKALLKKYDYPWNESNNGSMRKI